MLLCNRWFVAAGSALLALSAGTHATPLPASPPETGIAIPLFKRASVAAGSEGGVNSTETSNGTTVVNFAAIKRHIMQVDAKYKQGVLNYQQNTGQLYIIPEDSMNAPAPNNTGTAQPNSTAQTNASGGASDGNDNQHPATTFATILKLVHTKIKTLRLDKPSAANVINSDSNTEATLDKRQTSTGSQALGNYQNDLLWAGAVQVGSGNEQFLIDMDTGSADFWIPSSDCTSHACSVHRRYNAAASKTSRRMEDTSFHITYGDGSTSSGPVYTDSVTIAGLSATNQHFSAVTDVNDSFSTDVEDGILGLAYQSISELNQPPFFQTLMAQKKVKAPMFSFRLAKTGSELFLGGANPAKYTGQISWHPLISRSYWLVTGMPTVNGVPTSNTVRSMAVDSGTTVIVAPPNDAQHFWASVPGAAAYPYAEGYWTFPCRSPPKVAFTFAGGSRAWTVSAADFNLGQVSRGSRFCVGAVIGQDIGLDAWILGDTFMKNTYTIFDMGQNRIGFATPK